MKKKYLFILALAATMFAACSSNEDITSDGTGGGETLPNGGAVTVRVNLPQVSGTRADFPDPEDGTENEYAVQTATIALYDANKVCVGLRTFTPTELGFKENKVDPAITSTSNVVIVLDKKVNTPKYALAVVNTFDGKNKLSPTIGSHYSDFQDAITEAEYNGKVADNDFMMTNSNFVSPDDGTKGVTEDGLQVINPASITTSAEVASESATQIYVERVSAKVTLKLPLDKMEGFGTVTKVDGSTVIDFNGKGTLTLKGWNLTTTNLTYFPVKHIDINEWNNVKYQLSNDWSNPAAYRTYWAKDPNYNYLQIVPSGMLDGFNYVSYNAMTGKFDENGKVQYCLENTFNKEGQYQNATTSVILAGVYRLTAQANVVPAATGTTPDPDIISINGTVYSLDDAKLTLANNIKAAGYTEDANTPISADKIKITAAYDANTNVAVTVTYGDEDLPLFKDGSVSADKIKDVIKKLYASQGIQYYVGGKCFYTVMIKNFTDNEVQLWDDESKGTFYKYGDEVQNNDPYSWGCLGRYGIVRNTSYTVNIQSISGIGKPIYDPEEPTNPDPKDPEDPPTPDDTKGSVISAQINILPWAVRSQDVNL